MGRAEDLFNRHLPLARRIARGVHRGLPRSVEYGDVESAALLGLWQAASGGVEHENFEAYARVRVRGAVMDELRRQDWLPRRREGSPASGVVIVYDDLGLTRISHEGSGAEDALAEKQKQEILSQSLGRLSARDRRVMERLLEGAKQSDLALELGVSAPRVSQISSRAIASLKKLVRAHGRRRGRRNRRWSVPTPSSLMARGMTRLQALAEYANSLYAARQALGLCGNCNRPPLPGRKKCAVHATPKERYHDFKAAGRCVSCGLDPKPGKRCCEKCLRMRANTRKKAVISLKERGLCVSCGLRPADGRSRCADCKAKRKASAVGSRSAWPPPSSTTTSSPTPRAAHASGTGSTRGSSSEGTSTTRRT